MNKHFVRIDINNNIIKGFSDEFEDPTEIDICITENGSRHFVLLAETNPPLLTFEGKCRYQYVDGNVILKPEEAVQVEVISDPITASTEFDKLRADIDYLLMLNEEV